VKDVRPAAGVVPTAASVSSDWLTLRVPSDASSVTDARWVPGADSGPWIVVSPDDFDVDPTGATSSAVGIQAAEDAADAEQGRVELLFPGGNYLIDQPIQKSPRTRWRGTGVRYGASATEKRRSQGARLVCGFDGDMVSVPGYGVRQRGGIRGMQFSNTLATHPNARGIVFDSDTLGTGQVTEFFLEDVVVGGFDFDVWARNAGAVRLYDCYLFGAGTDGLYAEGCNDWWLWQTQFSGARYGCNLVDSNSFNGSANRFQSSGVANLRIIGGGFHNLPGGSNDAGDGFGVLIEGGQTIRLTDVVYYANGDDCHVVVASAAGQVVSGVELSGTFHPGSTGTQIGARFDATGGGVGSVQWITLGGDFRIINTAYVWVTGAPSSFQVAPGSMNVAARQYNSIDFFGTVEFKGASQMVFSSPDGTRWLLSVDDAGDVVTTEIVP
jgi:hypothetical protein